MAGETEFNASLRSVLRGQGLGAIAVRESDFPGVADVMVWEKPRSTLLGWLELKVDDEPLRPSQVEFLREVDRDTGNAFVVRNNSGTGITTIERPTSPSGWSIDRKRLQVIHAMGSLAAEDWAVLLARLRRSRRCSSRVTVNDNQE